MFTPRVFVNLYSFKSKDLFSSTLRCISTSCVQCKKNSYEAPVPKKWPVYNELVYPPQSVDEPPRPAYVCHLKDNIKYSPWKMWYIAAFVRGMSVDEALRQLDFINRKGAIFVKNTILEAQDIAVERENVEFRSNLWIAESFVTKGLVIKGIRRHARKQIGIIEYFHCHYYVRLEEGSPPADYHKGQPDGPTLLQRWIQERRNQRIQVTY